MALFSALPFWFHILIELPASLNFFFFPSEQLSVPAPQAHAVIKQYAILLLSSTLVALIFALRDFDRTSKNVAAALAVYHLAPLVRAASRILGEEDFGRGLGGPIVHFLAHGVCFSTLIYLYFRKDAKIEEKMA